MGTSKKHTKHITRVKTCEEGSGTVPSRDGDSEAQSVYERGAGPSLRLATLRSQLLTPPLASTWCLYLQSDPRKPDRAKAGPGWAACWHLRGQKGRSLRPRPAGHY